MKYDEIVRHFDDDLSTEELIEGVYEMGVDDGHESGYREGYSEGESDGREYGYDAGWQGAKDSL